MAKADLTAQRLRELLDYDPLAGVFTRKMRNANCVRVGQVAGYTRPNGYVCIRVDGKSYLAHRLAWMYSNGEWPAGVVDHIDGNTSNNRIANLRDVPHASNMQNQRAAQAHSISGILGVSRVVSGWKARITVGGKKVNLGIFHTHDLAAAAYVTAKRELHAGCTI